MDERAELATDEMAIPALVKADRDLDAGSRRQLVGTLFASPTSLAIGAGAGTVAGLITAFSTTDPWCVAAGLTIPVVATLRVVHSLIEQRRSRMGTSSGKAEFFYEIGAWVFSALLGLLAFCVLTRTTDGPLHLLVVCVAIGYAAGICARNAGRPVIALGQLALAALPITPALALSNEPVHWALAAINLTFILALADITRKTAIAFKSAAANSEAREAELKETLEHLPNLIWRANPAGEFTYHSRRWKEFTGFDMAEFDHHRRPFIHPNDKVEYYAAWRSSLKTGARFEAQYRLRHKSGDYRWMLSRAMPEYDGSGHIVQWHGACVELDYEDIVQRSYRAKS